MNRSITRWAICCFGLLMLVAGGCASKQMDRAEKIMDRAEKVAADSKELKPDSNVEVNVVQFSGAQGKMKTLKKDGTNGVMTLPEAASSLIQYEEEEPAPAPEPVVWVGASPLTRAARRVQYQPDSSRSFNTETILSEICKEVAGKVYYELKENGERHLTSRVAVVGAVPLSDFKRETEFGRMISEYLLTDLADRGIKVTELRLGKEINILPQTGEFILSRNIAELANDAPMLDYVLVSTFTNTRKTLIVQGRLVGLKTGLVESSWRYALPLNREILGLFHDAEKPYTIAVKGMKQ